MVDRFILRQRPAKFPIMYQTWDQLLFMNWPITPQALRPFIPSRLTIDTFDSMAWITITPFTMRNVRLPFTPSMPFLSHFHELNVRTYVHLDGIPGICFFSLDASRRLAVHGARSRFYLPYFTASMNLRKQQDTIHYTSERIEKGAPCARFEALWTKEADLPEPSPDSLAFFLVERYCLYTRYQEKLYRSRIFHAPWPLRSARVQSYFSSMISAFGLPEPEEKPFLWAQAAPLKVGIWPLQKV